MIALQNQGYSFVSFVTQGFHLAEKEVVLYLMSQGC